MRELFGLDKISTGTLVKNVVMIIIGSFISAIGINTFLVPHNFVASGVAGLSQFLSYITPLSVATYLFVLNIPIFIFGWRYVGRVGAGETSLRHHRRRAFRRRYRPHLSRKQLARRVGCDCGCGEEALVAEYRDGGI